MHFDLEHVEPSPKRALTQIAFRLGRYTDVTPVLSGMKRRHPRMPPCYLRGVSMSLRENTFPPDQIFIYPDVPTVAFEEGTYEAQT